MKYIIVEDEIGDKEVTVEEVIDNHTKWWDLQRIRSYFPSTIANKVLKIMLVTASHDDTQIWMHEKDENFSVRSAYKLFKELDKKRVEEKSFNTINQSYTWKYGESKSAWREYINGMPIKSNLKKRKVLEDEVSYAKDLQ